MPHEIEYTNPQIKNFYNPRIKVLQARNTKDNDSQIQKKNIQSSKLNQNENGWLNKIFDITKNFIFKIEIISSPCY